MDWSTPPLAKWLVEGEVNGTYKALDRVAFVIPRGDAVDTGDAIVQELWNHISKEIGPIARPMN
nr:hypothetical protein [Arthrobacter sp. U41]